MNICLRVKKRNLNSDLAAICTFHELSLVNSRHSNSLCPLLGVFAEKRSRNRCVTQILGQQEGYQLVSVCTSGSEGVCLLN